VEELRLTDAERLLISSMNAAEGMSVDNKNTYGMQWNNQQTHTVCNGTINKHIRYAMEQSTKRNKFSHKRTPTSNIAFHSLDVFFLVAEQKLLSVHNTDSSMPFNSFPTT
jgi:hypothetical protein